jgi:hypothetical protein
VNKKADFKLFVVRVLAYLFVTGMDFILLFFNSNIVEPGYGMDVSNFVIGGENELKQTIKRYNKEVCFGLSHGARLTFQVFTSFETFIKETQQYELDYLPLSKVTYSKPAKKENMPDSQSNSPNAATLSEQLFSYRFSKGTGSTSPFYLLGSYSRKKGNQFKLHNIDITCVPEFDLSLSFNDYIYQFYKHGNLSRVEEENGIRPGIYSILLLLLPFLVLLLLLLLRLLLLSVPSWFTLRYCLAEYSTI